MGCNHGTFCLSLDHTSGSPIWMSERQHSEGFLELNTRPSLCGDQPGTVPCQRSVDAKFFMKRVQSHGAPSNASWLYPCSHGQVMEAFLTKKEDFWCLGLPIGCLFNHLMQLAISWWERTSHHSDPFMLSMWGIQQSWGKRSKSLHCLDFLAFLALL